MEENNIKQGIRDNIDDPEKLEALYRANNNEFKKSFSEIYNEISDNKIAAFWNARLEYDKDKDKAENKSAFLYVVIVSLVNGFLIKLPQIFAINEKYEFYSKNAALIVTFSLMMFFFLTKGKINKKNIIYSMLTLAAFAIYINILPVSEGRNTINLIFLYSPILLWGLYGLIYINFSLNDKSRIIDYIKYNVDIFILSAIIMIVGAILIFVTSELFQTVKLEFSVILIEYIFPISFFSLPIIATYIIKKYPAVTNKIAPVIANIFSPMTLAVLLIYLISVVFVGIDSVMLDRRFLLSFNIMLMSVMALIIASVSGIRISNNMNFNNVILFLLTIISLVVDLYALFAILYRLTEFGFTPNRIVVLGANLLIFVHLVLIMIALFNVVYKKYDIKNVIMEVINYLPVYIIWAAFVVFILPLIFGYK